MLNVNFPLLVAKIKETSIQLRRDFLRQLLHCPLDSENLRCLKGPLPNDFSGIFELITC